jgi:hypothetical protein
VIFYAIASILDHADSEIARLTFQEPSPAPTWTVDTIIRAGLVLGMAVTAGGAASSAPSGSPSARSSPATSRSGLRPARARGMLKGLGSRDLVYLLLLSFVAFRWLAPPLLQPLPVVVGIGSQV